MGLLEVIILILIIAAVFGRGRLNWGTPLDLLIGVLVILLLYRLLVSFGGVGWRL